VATISTILEEALERAKKGDITNVMVILVDAQDRWSINMPKKAANGTGRSFLKTAVKFFIESLLKDG
jgi:hypothetical protein